jgi:predicted PurR-regulated permease PerM
MAAHVDHSASRSPETPATSASASTEERTIVLSIRACSVVLLIAIIGGVWLLGRFSDIALLLLIGGLLAIAIAPMVNWLGRYVPRALAILLIYLALIGLVGVAVGLLVPVLITEIGQLRADLPQLAYTIETSTPAWITRWLPMFSQSVSLGDFARELTGQLGGLVGGVGAVLAGVASVLVSGAVGVFLVLVIAFFLLADRTIVLRTSNRLLPARYRPAATTVARTIGQQVGQWARAQALIGLFVGITFGMGLKLLGVPYAFSLGCVGAVLEFVPYLGGAIVTTVAALIALTVSPWLPLAVLLLEAMIALIEGHVLYPKFVGGRVGLHPVVVIVALLVGASVRGIVGVLIAVPMTIVLRILFDQFYRFNDQA